tara:strand:+ start:65 stop:484 length:420 start_codon:yes stop_codon:yes gene_type:complete
MQQPNHYDSAKEITFFQDERGEKQGQMPVSKAGRLAMELSAEKKRLLMELKELQAENDDLKSTTPTGTVDWYVKWLATCLSVCGIFLMSAGFTNLGQVSYALSAIGWVFVGIQWSDRAIMIGSSIGATAVMMNLVTALH